MRIMAIAFLILTSSVCRADDWPRFRGAAADGHVAAGVPVPLTLRSDPEVAWHLPVGFGIASPVVSGDKVFYLDNQGDKETVHAAVAASGKDLWTYALDDVYKDFQTAYGPRCAPVVDGDRVYVQSCRGEFACLDAATGKRLWGANFVNEFGATMPAEQGENLGGSRHGNTGTPVVEGDRVIVAVGSHKGASLVAFNKSSGRVLWKSQSDSPGHGGPIVAAVGGVRQVVAFTAEALVGLDLANGALLWRVPIETQYGRNVMTPVIFNDTVVVGTNKGGIYGIRVTRKGGAFHAEQAWNMAGQGVNFASPVAVGPYLYGIGPANMLFCVDMRTGQNAWVAEHFFSQIANTGWAGFVVMGRNILALTDGGALVLFAADPKQCHEIGRAEHVCGKNWCNPAYAGGRLYLRDAAELRCLRLLP